MNKTLTTLLLLLTSLAAMAQRNSNPQYPGGMKAALKYLVTKIPYPAQAIANNEEGTVAVEFIITKDGTPTSVVARFMPSGDNLTRSAALEYAVANAILFMPKWIPAFSNGQPVDTKASIPIHFKLYQSQEECDRETALDKQSLANVIIGAVPKTIGGGNLEAHEEEEENTKIYDKVDQLPQFPGGDKKLFDYIGKNLQYPPLAQESGVQGRVIVTFVVERDGSITEPKLVRGVDPNLDKEALRVIQTMPRWTPGKQKGKAVRVKYTIPVTFRLQ